MKRVLVFCGSRPGGRPEYAECATALGRLLASRDLEVVYGGAHVGLMGALADAALGAGGKVIGVIPNRLVEAEIAHAGLTELHVVDSMHERKALMAELSDAVIALPGGTGTLDELFELFTWSQLGLHRMPIGLLDVSGYWQPLLGFLEHAVNERFLRAEHFATLLVEGEPGPLLDRLASYQHQALDKWLDRRGADQAVPNTRSPASPNPGRM
ncbi:MAG: LOG family protein [Solirubrobacteraceae bacterium]